MSINNTALKEKQNVEDFCGLFWGKKDCLDTALQEQQNVGR